MYSFIPSGATRREVFVCYRKPYNRPDVRGLLGVGTSTNITSCSDTVFSVFARHIGRFRVRTQLYVGQLLGERSGRFVNWISDSPTHVVIGGTPEFWFTSEQTTGNATPALTNFGLNAWNGADERSIWLTRCVTGPSVARGTSKAQANCPSERARS